MPSELERQGCNTDAAILTRGGAEQTHFALCKIWPRAERETSLYNALSKYVGPDRCLLTSLQKGSKGRPRSFVTLSPEAEQFVRACVCSFSAPSGPASRSQ